jgi:hypothetical protein
MVIRKRIRANLRVWRLSSQTTAGSRMTRISLSGFPAPQQILLDAVLDVLKYTREYHKDRYKGFVKVMTHMRFSKMIAFEWLKIIYLFGSVMGKTHLMTKYFLKSDELENKFDG